MVTAKCFIYDGPYVTVWNGMEKQYDGFGFTGGDDLPISQRSSPNVLAKIIYIKVYPYKEIIRQVSPSMGANRKGYESTVIRDEKWRIRIRRWKSQRCRCRMRHPVCRRRGKKAVAAGGKLNWKNAGNQI